MTPYPAYKDSGIEWLGEIPEHWETKRAKNIYCEVNEKSEDGTETLLSVSEYYGVAPRSKVIEEGDWLTRASSLVGYKKCQTNDLVMNIMLAWKRGLGVTAWNGIVSPSYAVFRCLSNKHSPQYLHYLLRTELYIAEFRRNSTGVIDSRLRLYPDEFLRVYIISPPLPEQRAIAAFLDHKTRLIDTYVAKKQQQIEHLQTYRTALINQAVTKGLNPDAPMKDSGIEWLGEIPVSWEIVQLGRLIRLQRGVDITKAQQVEGNIPVVSSGGISSYHNKSTARGPGVIVGRKGTLGTVHYVESDYWAHDTTLWVKEFKGSYPRYIYYLLKIMRLERFDTGSANPTLNRNIVHPEYVPFTPKKEQMEIASYLDEQTAKIDNLIAKTQHQIDRLQAYRTALISDAVTGKIDVRTDNYRDYT